MRLKKIALATAGSLAISLSAYAGMLDGYNGDWSTGWYLGAGINRDSQTTMDLKSTFDIGGTITQTDVKQTNADIGFDVFVGRQISNYWAAEMGFTYVGDVDFKAKEGGVNVEKLTVEQWNVHLVGVGMLPLGDYFNAFAKLGAAYYQNESKWKDLTGAAANLTEKSHTFAVTYGVGIGVEYEQFGLRAEYNVIRPAENVQDDFYVSDLIGLNAYYKFM